MMTDHTFVRFIRSIRLSKHWRSYAIIKSQFDAEFYSATYLAIPSKLDPIGHYLTVGSKRGYKPRPDFDPAFYIQRYPDVMASGMDPFVHYVKHGKYEGRETECSRNEVEAISDVISMDDYDIIRSGFDKRYYIATYKDVAEAGIDPVGHYLVTGWLEGRNPSATFDTRFYLSRYSDVALSGTNPFVHYLKIGRAENRAASEMQLKETECSEYTLRVTSPHSRFLDSAIAYSPHDLLFDSAWYSARYPDVNESRIEPLRHYLNSGVREGRDPHPMFHTRFYLSQVNERKDAIADPLSHYLQSGTKHGLSPHPLFDRLWYRFGNRDVIPNGMDEFVHFILVGDKQGRSSHPLFDPVFYLRNNPEVASAGIGPLRHFLEFGGREWRNPHPLFDCKYYHWVSS